MPESGWGFGVRTIHYLILFSEESVPELPSRFSGLLSYVTEIVCIRGADVGPLKICSESILELFPTSNCVFGKAFKPVPGWPFKLKSKYFMAWRSSPLAICMWRI